MEATPSSDFKRSNATAVILLSLVYRRFVLRSWFHLSSSSSDFRILQMNGWRTWHLNTLLLRQCACQPRLPHLGEGNSTGIELDYEGDLVNGVIHSSLRSRRVHWNRCSLGIPTSIRPRAYLFDIHLNIGRSFRVSGRTRSISKNPSMSRKLNDQVTIIVAQASLCLVYPAFGEVYNALPPTQQALLIVTLPTMKANMNHVVAFASRNGDESMIGITLMSVEAFNALYSSSTCKTQDRA